MARTKQTGFAKNHECIGGYMYKSKRKKVKIYARNTHHALRNLNRYSSQLNFTCFKQSEQRKLYTTRKNEQEKTALSYINQLQINQGLEDSSRKVLQDKLLTIKKYRKDHGGRQDHGKKETDMYKMIRRRGNLKPFMGHRNFRQLYKHQLFFWQ